MKQVLTVLGVAAILAQVTCAQDKPAVSVAGMPPSVVKTVPQAGALNVDPSLTEVRVTFSKDMITKDMWSWCMSSKDTFPEINAAKIHYLADKRTCVLPVKLVPGKTYVIWVNSMKFKNFRDVQNIPAVPYLIVFRTGLKDSTRSQPAGRGAVASAQAWLNLVDTGNYGQSWEDAATFFKGAVAKNQWPTMIQAVRGPLGKVLSRKVKSKVYKTALPGAPDGQYMVIQYQTSFEKKRSAIETVTPMLDKDGQWRVSGYFIR